MSHFTANALSSAAFVLLTVVIVNSLWSLLGGEPLWRLLTEFRDTVSVLSDSQSTGLRRIVHASGSLLTHAQWMQRLKSASNSVDLMGYTLHVWSRGENFENEIVNLVRRGVRIRVLIMDPENPHFESVINHQIAGVTPESSQGEAHAAIDLFERIESRVDALQKAKRLGSFEFRRVRQGTILCQICRTDSELTAISYLYSEVASRTPLVEVQGSESGLFRVYATEFERLWDQNGPVAA